MTCRLPSYQLYRVCAELLPTVLQQAVHYSQIGKLRHHGTVQQTFAELLRRKTATYARYAHSAGLRRQAVHVAQLLWGHVQENDGRHGQQPYPPVCDAVGKKRPCLRLVGFPSSLRLGLRIPPTPLPHVQKTRRHHHIAVLPQPAQLMPRIDVGSWLRAYLVKDTPPPCVYSPKQQIIYCCAGLFAYCSQLAKLPKYLQICRLPPLFYTNTVTHLYKSKQ